VASYKEKIITRIMGKSIKCREIMENDWGKGNKHKKWLPG
jgi:hypothetical protein